MEQPEDDEKQHGADRGHDHGGDESAADVDAQARQQPSADQGTDYSNADVGDDAETGASNDLPGKPTGDETDEQNDENALVRHALNSHAACPKVTKLAFERRVVTRTGKRRRTRTGNVGVSRCRRPFYNGRIE